MIQTLSIKNYALIEDLEIDFSNGLTIITGETGAGKSILLGALGLIMGERADLKKFYDQNEKCIIEGHFKIDRYNLKPFFAEHELDYDDELVVRREITPSGKSRAFVNDTPVTLDILKTLSGALIDLHQQFDTLDIHEVSFQLKMLDALAGNHALLETYSQTFRQYQKNQRRLEALVQQHEASMKEMDFLQFQLDEFEEIQLEDGEQETLEEELDQLNNAEDIKKALSGAFMQVSEHETAIVSQLKDVQRNLSQVEGYNSELKVMNEKLENLTLEIEDLGNSFGDLGDKIEYDPERIQEVETRLNKIYRLQKKHQVNTIAELLEIQEKLQFKFEDLEGLDSEIGQLDDLVGQQEGELGEIAAKLAEARRAVAPGFEQKIMNLLAELSMASSQLKIDIQESDELLPTGKDHVKYLFSANKGGRLNEIKTVASGGEISRLTLVTKSLVASSIPLPTLIFDEIDSGVSGDVALKMGNILRKLSNEHQVVVITHSPQVASKANAHYFVYKEESAEKTYTRVKLLEETERIHTLAVMLSQNPPSDAALENAKGLLATAN
ncbi:MAG: DNA repair protein RecN [Saprospiraceae bacterium]|nr:DNA repair protein RecN [Saprospiraceae bacterium]